MRVFVYARYSSDRQRETSIDDQLRVCKAFAERQGWSIQCVHSDEEVSGSTPVAARRGGNALLADVLAGRFDVLLLEGLDRLARDSVEQEKVIRRLEHRNIRIVGVADGYDSESSGRKLHRGMRGLINEVFLDDLRCKTHRGQSGQVSRGYSAGGGGYGYQSVHDGNGYVIEIEPEQAKWVLWIHERFAEGWAVRRIASELNAQRVPSPRGGTWAVSGIYGSPVKGTGILNNPLYVGRYIWNRSQWVKDPDTGRRQRLERPESEWQIEMRPALRIVPEELWRRVRERIDGPRANGKTANRGRGPRTLFGGLLLCDKCGGAMVAVNAKLYGCSFHHDRGETVCSGVYAPRNQTDSVLLMTVRDDLLSPSTIAEFAEEAEQLLVSSIMDDANSAKALRARVAELEQEINRLVDAIASIGISEALRTRLALAENERDALIQKMKVVSIDRLRVRDVVKEYKKRMEDARRVLGSNDIAIVREGLKQIVGPINVFENSEGLWASLRRREIPALQIQAPGFVYKSGSGGLLPPLYTIKLI